MTHREQILDVIGLAGRPLDDDEIARRTGISPRQAVNQMCRRLEAEGVFKRSSGPDGKIANLPQRTEAMRVTEAAVVSDVPATMDDAVPIPPGSSSEQRLAERQMLDALGDRLGVRLDPRTVRRDDGVRVEIDGADADLTVLVECWAHQGPAKVAQKYKLANDALKLHWIGMTMAPVPRKILCVSDTAAVQHLRGRSWQGQALRDLGIEIEVVMLPDDVRASVISAQARQFR